jgi:hypothetical protein
MGGAISTVVDAWRNGVARSPTRRRCHADREIDDPERLLDPDRQRAASTFDAACGSGGG